jgi:hypothetical protein
VAFRAFLKKRRQVGIAFLGEVTYLMKDVILDQVNGVGWPPLKKKSLIDYKP